MEQKGTNAFRSFVPFVGEMRQKMEQNRTPTYKGVPLFHSVLCAVRSFPCKGFYLQNKFIANSCSQVEYETSQREAKAIHPRQRDRCLPTCNK